MRLCHRKQDDFNPRARVGRDVRYFLHALNAVISIHAPAWGATKIFLKNFQATCISIHAPAWGATQTQFILSLIHDGISIHAPVWGATDYRYRRYIAQ